MAKDYMETRHNVVLRRARHLARSGRCQDHRVVWISFKRFPTTPSFNTGSTTSASKPNLKLPHFLSADNRCFGAVTPPAHAASRSGDHPLHSIDILVGHPGGDHAALTRRI